ncbi:MAG: hypothetical protein ACI4P4_15200 [Faecousia sp.]
MKCNCGYENSAGALFCARCGCTLSPVKQPRPKRFAFIAVFAVVLALGILAFALLYESPAEQAMKAIDAIGAVTLDSEEAIKLAEEKYGALNAKNREKVTNKDVLEAAREEFNRQKKLIDDAIEAIDAIGQVTLDSGDVISDARFAYEKARAVDTGSLLEDARKTLEAAEAEYNRQINDQENIMNMGLAEIDGAVSLILSGDPTQAHTNLQYYLSKLTEPDKLESFETAIVDAFRAEAENQYRGGSSWMAMQLLSHTEPYQNHCASSTLEDAQALEDQITTALNKNRPQNGAILARTCGAGRNSFKITAGEYDSLVKVEMVDDPEKYGLFYIRGNETATFYFNSGTYRIKYTVGPVWYGENDLFGPDATYVLLDDTISPNTYTSGGYIHWSKFTWTITVGYGENWGYQNMEPSQF